MNLFNGKLILVTGAGRGNGAAIAKGLVKYGARVIVTDIDGDTARQTAAEIKADGGEAWAYVMDVANLDQCHHAAAQIKADVGPIDVLVNNAGVLSRISIDDPGAREAWDMCMNVNATGVFNTTIAFIPHLRETKGNIVNMASITGFAAVRTFPGYCASKAAVISMTKGFAGKLAPDGIRVNAIAPGPFATPMTAATRANNQANSYMEGRILLGRFGQPEEIVGPVAFMASDMAGFITGETLVVDGGVLSE